MHNSAFDDVAKIHRIKSYADKVKNLTQFYVFGHFIRQMNDHNYHKSASADSRLTHGTYARCLKNKATGLQKITII